MIVCGTKDNSLRERLLRECDLTLSKAISAGHAAEETRKHAREILRSQPSADIDKIFKKKLNKSNHNTRNQNKRDLVPKLTRTNLRNTPIRVTMNFLLKLLVFRILHILTKSRMKTLIGQ